jgi:hypothetical protein
MEGAIQRFRSGVKNSQVIELHNTCHYVFIVDEALVVRETRKLLLEEMKVRAVAGCRLSGRSRMQFIRPSRRGDGGRFSQIG